MDNIKSLKYENKILKKIALMGLQELHAISTQTAFPATVKRQARTAMGSIRREVDRLPLA